MPDPDLTCAVCGSAYKAAAYGGACPRCLMGAATAVSGAARFEVLPSEELNAVLTEFEVAELVGTGGMGAVYRARQMDLDREVAIKLLSPEAGGDPEFAERFAREAKVLGALAHPNIVPVYGIGFSDDGMPFYSMKLVKGRTLQEIIGQLREGGAGALKTYPLAALLTVFRKVCDAMAFAHSQGILHRDLKPANVMVGEFGEVLVMDWGLARRRSNEECLMPNDSTAGGGPSEFDLPASSFTLAGAVLGTPQYMSPEQARGETDSLDERADIFSLGGILYAILTLRPPVEGSTMAELLEKARSGTVAAPVQHGSTVSGRGKNPTGAGPGTPAIPLRHLPAGRVPAALSAVVMKAMAREKADRYQSVSALSADVEAYQGGFATSAEKAGTWMQLKLLMRRHRVVTALLALMLAVSAGFVLKVIASERRATLNAALAKQNESAAIAEKEGTRRALAQAQVAVADATAIRLDTVGLKAALETCPADLRDSSWQYLSRKADASIARLNFFSTGVVWRRTGKGAAGGEFLAAHESLPVIIAIEPDTGRVLRELKTVITGRKRIGLRPGGAEIIISSDSKAEGEILDCDTGASNWHHTPQGIDRWDNPFISADGTRVFALIVKSGSSVMVCMDRGTRAIQWEQQGWYCCYYSPDGEWIGVMSAAPGKPLKVLRADTGEIVSHLEPGHTYLEDLSFSADNARIVAADIEGYATVWDRATGRRIQSFRACSGMLDAAGFTSNGTVVTRGRETNDPVSQRVLQVWNPDRVIQLDALLGSGKVSVGGFLALDPVGGWLCTDGDVTRLWQVPVQRHRQQITYPLPVPRVTFLGNSTLVALQQGAPADLRRLGPGGPELLPQAPGSLVSTSDGNRLLTAVGGNLAPVAHIASLAADGSVSHQQMPWKIYAHNLALSRAGDMALADDFGANALLYTPGSAGPLRKMTLTGMGRCKQHAFAENDQRLISTGHMRATPERREEDFLACWDRDTGALVYHWTSAAPILALAVSPDGHRFAWAGADKFIHIHTAINGREERVFRAHDAAINGLAWHPTRPLIASVSDDLSLKLWDPNTGRFLSKALGISRSLLSAAFSPDGKTLAVGTADPLALIFDTNTALNGQVPDNDRP